MNPLWIFALWSLWISAEFLLGPYAHVRIADSGMGGIGGIPELVAVKNQFLHYGYSYFGNFLPGGVDLSSNLHTPFSYLNSLLFFIFPGYIAYGLLMLAQRFLASYFTYRLCRDSLKFTFFPSFIAGLIYSLFNFSQNNFTTFHQLSEPAIPFFLWAIDRLDLKRANFKYVMASVLGLFWGYSTYVPYGVLIFIPFSSVWFLTLVRKVKKDFWLMFTMIAVSSIVIQIPQLWSLMLNAPFSQRIERQIFPNQNFILNYLNEVKSVLTQFEFQTIFILSLILILKKKALSQKFLIISILTSVIILVSPAISFLQFFLKDQLGFAKSFQFSRFIILAPLLMTIMLAYLVKETTRLSRFFPSFNMLVTFIIILLIFSMSVKVKVQTLKNYSPYKVLYQHPTLKNLAQEDKSIYRVATVTGGGLLPAYAYAYGLETVDGYMALYPGSYFRFWGRVIDKALIDNHLRYEDYFSQGTRIYLFGPKNYAELEIIDFENYFDLSLLSAANVKYLISRKPLISESLILLPSLYRGEIKIWQGKTLLQKLRIFLEGKYFGPPLYIYQNTDALPRFYVLSNEQLIKNAVSVERYSPDVIELSINTQTDGQLIAAINYYPFWHVFVDGTQREIEKYNQTFMRVNITKDDEKVTFKYLPPYKFF